MSMTPAPPHADQPAPLTALRPGARRWVRYGGAGAAVLAIVLSFFLPLPALNAEWIVTWIVGLGLSAACLSMADRPQRLLWVGLAFAPAVAAAWSQGWSAALLLAVLAGVIAPAIRRWAAPAQALTLREAGDWVALGWLPMLPALLSALAVTALFGVTAPARLSNLSHLLPIVLASGLACLIRLAFCAWLIGRGRPMEALSSAGYTARLLASDVLLTAVIPWFAVALFPSYAGWVVAASVLVAAYFYRTLPLQAERQALSQRIGDLTRDNSGLAQVTSITRRALDTLEIEDACAHIAAVASGLAQADAAAIFLLDVNSNRLRLKASQGMADAQAAIWAAIDTVSDVFNEALHEVQAPSSAPQYPELGSDTGFKALVEVRLLPANKPIGLLRLYFKQPRRLTASERQQLLDLAQNASVIIDALDWFGVMESYAYQMAQLAHLARISSSSLAINDIVGDMSGILRQMVPVGKVTLALVRPKTGASPILELMGDASEHGTIAMDSVAELAALRQQPRPRPKLYMRSDPTLSNAMQGLIAMHGETLAVFPLLSHYDLLGLILLGDAAVTGFSDHQWQLLEMASNQIASHALNARLYALTQQDLEQRLEQLSMLATLAQQISGALDQDTILSTMLEMAIRSTDANVGSVALFHEGEGHWKIIHYQDYGSLVRSQRARIADDPVIGQVIRTRETLVIADTRQTAYYLSSHNPNLYLSAVAMPLISDNNVIGVLHLESLRPNFFNKEQISFLTNLARHAVISIENARLLEERHRQIFVLKQLQSLSVRLSSVTETLVVATQVLETAMELLDGGMGALFRVQDDGDGRRIDVVAQVNPHGLGVNPAALFRNTNLALRTAQTGETQIVQNVRDPSAGSEDRFGLLSVPIKRGERVREVLCVAFASTRSLGKRDLEAAALLVSQASGHLENATLHEYIRSGNDRMRAILNSTRDGIVLLDKVGRLVETNPSARRLLGIDLDEHIGENLVDVLLQYASTDEFENAGYNREEVTALARQLRLEPERITRRQFARTLPKSTLYIEEIGSPVVDSESQISGRLLVLRDVTEQKLLADYRDEITNMAVHDLRGPLASIISSLTFTLDETGVSSDQGILRKTLSLSLDSANNLMRLVESMLDIARLEKRQMPVRLTPTPLKTLVDDAVQALESSIQSAGVSLDIKVADDLPAVTVDQDMMRRVFVNLIDNALRFTPHSGKIMVEATECPDHLLVQVADSGPGIPEEERERIFERFRQVKSTVPVRGNKGAGLGLTFARLAVEAHGGRIWVEAQGPLPGACFAMSLPYQPPQITR